MDATQTFAFAQALAVATLTLCAIRWASRAVDDSLPAADPPPWPFRVCRVPIAAIAAHVERFVPPGWLERVGRRLSRAQLDGTVSATQWVAATLLLGSASLIVVLAISFGREAGGGAFVGACAGSLCGAIAPQLWLHSRIGRVGRQTVRELPGFLDVLTLALESGASLTPALAMAVDRGRDDPLRTAVRRALREMRAGRNRADALGAMAARVRLSEVDLFAAALRQADASGASLGAMLRAQSAQRLTERFARAEKLAMEAPTRMLAPLILCIFPCTFIVLAFPLVVRIAAGW